MDEDTRDDARMGYRSNEDNDKSKGFKFPIWIENGGKKPARMVNAKMAVTVEASTKNTT
jgi:hypothetical protein